MLSTLRSFAALSILVAAIIAPPQSVSAKPKPVDRPAVQRGLPVAAAGTLLDFKRVRLPAFYRGKAWRILYMTRDFRQRPVLSTGIVVLPDRAPKNRAARKFVAWAHPTTGIARKCAPSLRKSPTEAISGLNDLVASGIVVTATDYPGLGTEGPTGYLVGKGQAYAVLDSVRAARQIPDVGGGGDYALWGYSQGGHAALFAASLAPKYAPELNLRGVAAVAPPTDLGRLLRANLSTVPGRILTSMTLASWTRKYGAPLRPLVDNQVAAVVDEVSRSCVDDLGGKLDALAAQKPLQKKFLNYDPAQLVPWDGLLFENSIMGLAGRVPVYVAQGAADDIVLPSVTSQFVRATCRNGAPVQFVSLAGTGHGNSVKAASRSAVNWLAARLRGDRAPSNCR